MWRWMSPRVDRSRRTQGAVVSRIVLAAALVGVALPVVSAWAESAGTIVGFRTKLEKWISTQQLISEEQSDWQAEREMLTSTRDLLRQRKEALEADIAKLGEASTAADEERRELLLERGELQRARRTLQEKIRTMEEQVLTLAPRLPAPLQKSLEPLLVQIPEDPEVDDLPLGRRLVNVLGVLVEAEKFNDTATLSGETRAVADDKRVQVRTLYWGLGQAVYVSAQGEIAGVGQPNADGWEFSLDPGLTDEASRFIDIYEGNLDAIEFVRLPVAIQ